MPISINGLLQWTGLTQKPAHIQNTFLEKISPTLQKPTPNVPPTSTLRWIGAAVGSIGSEVFKAIGRAEPVDVIDTLSMGTCLSQFGSTVADQAKAVVASPSFARGAGQLVIGVGKSAGTMGGLAAAWMLSFYALHHGPRRLAPYLHSFGKKESKPEETLATSMEKKNLTPGNINAIHHSAQQLQSHFETTPIHFITSLTEEVCLGNWQFNHAFDRFNTNEPGELTTLFQEAAGQLPLYESIAFEVALVNVDIPTIQTFFPKISDDLKNAVVQLLDMRTSRNLSCFASRAIREQRTEPTDFEKKYMDQWLNDYNQLHEEQVDLSPTQVVALMKDGMNHLAAQNQVPLLKINTIEKEEMPPSKWAKDLEQQVMKALNTRHDERFHNIEAIPKHGRCILAFNHSLFTADIAMALQRVQEKHQRESIMVIDEALTSLPVVSSTLHSLGYRLAEKSSFMRGLSNENIKAVAPGGAKEGLKPYEKANKLMWNRAKGFVRAHLVSGAPLVSIMSPQVDQIRQNKLSKSTQWIQSNVFEPLKVPLVPIVAAPTTLHKVRVDHFASDAHEAPPMPFNNLSNTDTRFRTHVSNIHKSITEEAQTMLNDKNQEILAETEDGSYPMAHHVNPSATH